MPSQTKDSPDFSKQVGAGLVFQTWTSGEPLAARSATRGPLRRAAVQCHWDFEACDASWRNEPRRNAHGCQNRKRRAEPHKAVDAARAHGCGHRGAEALSSARWEASTAEHD